MCRSVVQLFYDLDLTHYYRKCELRGPHLGKMAKKNTLFMFHPHGILASGFVVNGCWGRAFNSLTAEKDLDEPKNSGTVFLIARNLREWAPLFKVLCDLSGRLESATKGNIQKLMGSGRNIAIIPGEHARRVDTEARIQRTMNPWPRACAASNGPASLLRRSQLPQSHISAARTPLPHHLTTSPVLPNPVLPHPVPSSRPFARRFRGRDFAMPRGSSAR